jgi:hypothetical protein
MILSGIDNDINEEQTETQIFTTATYFCVKNEYSLIETKTPENYALNRLYYLKSPLKKLNLSQSIDVDYLTFPKKQTVTLFKQQKTNQRSSCYNTKTLIKSV